MKRTLVAQYAGQTGKSARLAATLDRPCADPEKAARRLMEHAQAFEPIQEGRIYIEKINGPFLFGDKSTDGCLLAKTSRVLVAEQSRFAKLAATARG